MIANMLVNTGIVISLTHCVVYDGVGMVRLWRQLLESYPYDSQYVGEHRHCDGCVVYE